MNILYPIVLFVFIMSLSFFSSAQTESSAVSEQIENTAVETEKELAEEVKPEAEEGFETFIPSEEISEDQAVPFPIDI